MNRSDDVDAWLDAYDNPQKELVAAIREHILACDDRVTEAIKWSAPTFVYKGNIASFFPKAKAHASLMFHKGATILGEHPILTGDGAEARSIKIADLAELDAKRDELTAVVKAWCDQQDG
ncbi:MAG: DUF1801 domain-containing protein [Actinomycetota bacterium]